MSPDRFRTLRQIHLDFHTPGFVPVGEKFNAVEFFDTLEAAEVNSITVFAQCHHGYAYFNSQIGPRHPGLSFDLFGAMAEEAAKREVQLLAYFSSNVNEVQAALHPEWHALKEDGSSVNSQILQDGSELYWTWMCPNRGGWIDSFFLPYVGEVLNNYPIDGVFVDMPCYLPGSCFCPDCLRNMGEQGLDPQNIAQHSHFNSVTNQDVAVALRKLMDAKQPGLRLEMGCYNAFGEAENARGVISEFYLESLAFQTGWQYFPLAARYFRKYGLPTVGMTGRFLKNWGDFGTVASPHQVKTQVGMHLMAGIPSSIGDHLHCNGKLDDAVYQVVGDAYRFIKPRQPYCVGMTPAREVAILVPEGIEANAASMDVNSPFLSILDAYKGAAKCVSELHYQYDMVSPRDPLDGYAVLVVTDGFFDMDFVERVKTFIAKGGWLVVSAHGLNPVDDNVRTAWQALVGVEACTLSSHTGAFYEVTDPRFRSTDLPEMAHYVHVPALDVTLAAEMAPIATEWRSPNVRSRETFYGHFHGPASEEVGSSIGVKAIGSGGVVVIGPQLFTAYLRTGYFAHRLLARNILDQVIPAGHRALRTNAPSVVELALGENDGRIIVQALPFITDRRDRYSFESLCDDPIPFHDIWVELPGVTGRMKAYDPIAECPVTTEQTETGLRLHLPEFHEHLVVVAEPLPAW
ncbi:MAG: alpha-amylase family protein [Armatimonadota bacterium]